MTPAPLTIRCSSSLDSATDANRLGCFIMGSQPTQVQLAGQHVSSRLLEPPLPLLYEQWLTTAPVTSIQDGNLTARFDGQLLMGAVHVDETQWVATATQTALERATASAYQQLFDVLDRVEYPHLWRAWNFVPHINTVTFGVERYRQFNQGRQAGFASRARPTEGNVPAACALGTHDGVLSIGFLAGRTKTIPIENPRQLSAFHYPAQYGVKAPTFSRAALGWIAGQELFLLSGTASIIGHETIHQGDVSAQTHESINNIEIIIAQANTQRTRQQPYELKDFSWRAFVRHEADLNQIQSVVTSRIGANVALPPVYLLMDICRDDLLVEIEGIAW